jgi:hypothetical protein
MDFLTLFSLCFAEIGSEIIDDAGVAIQFLGPLLLRSAAKPAARHLLFVVIRTLLRYHPEASFTAWRDVDTCVLEALRGGYMPYIRKKPKPNRHYPIDQLDHERKVVNVICDWASNDVKQPGEFQPGEYYPGMMMFIILHTSAIACHHEPTKQRARALAAEWLARLDPQQFTLCEGFMLDLYRLVNQTAWKEYPDAAGTFFEILEPNTLWKFPTGYDSDRWQKWINMNDDEGSETPGQLMPTGFTVFGLFENFLTVIFSYIRELVGTGYGINNAFHMMEWMQRMWGRVERFLLSDDPIKVNVQYEQNEIIAELEESSATPPSVDEGSSGSRSHSHGG